MSRDGHPEYKIERYIWGLCKPSQGLVTTSKPTSYEISKRISFSQMNQEIRYGRMVQMVDLPKAENRKKQFGKEFKGRARKSIEKKWKAFQAFAVMTTPTGTTTRSSPRCNEYGYRHIGTCQICPNYGKKGHLSNTCSTPTKSRNRSSRSSSMLGVHATWTCQEEFSKKFSKSDSSYGYVPNQ